MSHLNRPNATDNAGDNSKAPNISGQQHHHQLYQCLQTHIFTQVQDGGRRLKQNLSDQVDRMTHKLTEDLSHQAKLLLEQFARQPQQQQPFVNSVIHQSGHSEAALAPPPPPTAADSSLAWASDSYYGSYYVEHPQLEQTQQAQRGQISYGPTAPNSGYFNKPHQSYVTDEPCIVSPANSPAYSTDSMSSPSPVSQAQQQQQSMIDPRLAKGFRVQSSLSSSNSNKASKAPKAPLNQGWTTSASHPKYRTVPCKFFTKYGHCTFGDNCSYRHDAPVGSSNLQTANTAGDDSSATREDNNNTDRDKSNSNSKDASTTNVLEKTAAAAAAGCASLKRKCEDSGMVQANDCQAGGIKMLNKMSKLDH